MMFHITDLVSFFLILQKNESFHKFEAMPINCVLASTVVFNKTPLYRWHFLQLYLFDCCRNCNAVYARCMLQVGALKGGPEFCYRESYKCMCHCLEKHTPPEIPPFPWFYWVLWCLCTIYSLIIISLAKRKHAPPPMLINTWMLWRYFNFVNLCQCYLVLSRKAFTFALLQIVNWCEINVLLKWK